MKISLHVGPYMDRSFEAFFPKVRAWGYEAVELCGWRGAENVAGPGIKETLKILEDTELELHCISAQTGFGSEDDAPLRHTRDCIDVASELDCPVIATSTGSYVPDADRHATWDRVVRDITAAVEYASDRQVIMAIEPHFDCIVFTWESALKLMTEIDSPYFRINCDTAHWHACGLDDEVAVEKLKDYIVNVHLKDYAFIKPPLSDGIFEDIFRGNALGDGEFDLGRHIAQLHRMGYTGPLSGEFTGIPPDEDLDRIAQRSAKYMQLLLNRYRG